MRFSRKAIRCCGPSTSTSRPRAGEVNYGVSAGDDFHELPYAYVGPWDFATSPRTGPLWNAPFGAVHGLDLSADVDTLAADVTDFFRRVEEKL